VSGGAGPPPGRRSTWAGGTTAETSWAVYLDAFHGQRAGITETVLSHAFNADGADPYEWVAEPLPRSGRILDLACGSAPMAAHLAGRTYLGVDLSAAELAQAATRGVRVARADVAQLPVADRSVDAVVMSMALMLVPLQPTLREIARVLRPGGTFVATVPHHRPLPLRDGLRYARLCLALRHAGLHYPNDDQLRDPVAAFGAAGLSLQQDEATAFACHLGTADVAEQLLSSLYLPDVAARRLDAGVRIVRRWVGTDLTAPLRRFIAVR